MKRVKFFHIIRWVRSSLKHLHHNLNTGDRIHETQLTREHLYNSENAAQTVKKCESDKRSLKISRLDVSKKVLKQRQKQNVWKSITLILLLWKDTLSKSILKLINLTESLHRYSLGVECLKCIVYFGFRCAFCHELDCKDDCNLCIFEIREYDFFISFVSDNRPISSWIVWSDNITNCFQNVLFFI